MIKYNMSVQNLKRIADGLNVSVVGILFEVVRHEWKGDDMTLGERIRQLRK